MTFAELKQQLQAVTQLPDDALLCSGGVYAAALLARKALTLAISEIWQGAHGEELEAIRELMHASKREERRRRRPGRTGKFDTPAETWEAMRAASLAGRSLRSLSERFRVVYSVVLQRCRVDGDNGVSWGTETRRRPPVASNVIQFPRAVRS